MKKEKFTALFLTAFFLFVSVGCGNGEKNGRSEILFCFAGDSSDEFGGSAYATAIAKAEKQCKATVVELGSAADSFADTLSYELSRKEFDRVVIMGKEAYDGLSSYVKSYKGMNFVAVDCGLTEVRSNVTAVEFSPEEFGYLGAVVASDGGKQGAAGYLSKTRNSFDNRVLYGFLQGSDGETYVKYTEERSNVVKAMDYTENMYEAGAKSVFDVSGRSALGTLESASKCGGKVIYGGVDLKIAAAESKSEEVLSSIAGGVSKNYAAAVSYVCSMEEDGEKRGESIDLTVTDGAFSVNGTQADEAPVKKLKGNESEFQRLYAERVSELEENYTPEHSADAAYHEAVPSCADTNDWKYKPRAGSNGGVKPANWKGVGVWSTIYLQDGCNPVSNTGIEFKSMRIWAYTETQGWKLLEHANPTGAFYDENFTNDSHNSFVSNYINYGSEKRTRIKLDYSTIGYNYHPFGSQIDLVSEGFLNDDGSVKNGDTLYILSEMDIRLCVWDSSVRSDIDEAKYVANVGADWWRETGLQWSPDWNNNKDVCVGQFRTITKEWKKLYMTNVPSEKYEEIFRTFPFEK